MAKYGSNSIVIKVDNSVGTLVDLSQYITSFNGADIEAMTEESTTFGDSWVENLYTNMKRMGAVTLSGFYDDTASVGPHVVLAAIGDTRTLEITWGGAKTTSVEAVITNYKRLPSRGELTKFEATLLPTGAVTEA